MNSWMLHVYVHLIEKVSTDIISKPLTLNLKLIVFDCQPIVKMQVECLIWVKLKMSLG